MKSAALSILVVTMLAAFAAPAQEEISIRPLAVPFGANDKPSCVSLSEDGSLMVYQSRRTDGKGGADLWFSRMENGLWSSPYNPGPGINTSANEVDGKLSADGKTIVFIRGENFKESSSVYISQFRDGQWQTAERLPDSISQPGAVQFGAVLSHDGRRLYFSSNRAGGLGGFDIYWSERSGDSWSAPVNLGPPLNTPGDDADLALGRRGAVMILPARQPDSLGGVDLYISRLNGAQWSPLVNLGPRINTPVNDSCPWLGYDGRTLYVNSEWRRVGESAGTPAVLEIRVTNGF